MKSKNESNTTPYLAIKPVKSSKIINVIALPFESQKYNDYNNNKNKHQRYNENNIWTYERLTYDEWNFTLDCDTAAVHERK